MSRATQNLVSRYRSILNDPDWHAQGDTGADEEDGTGSEKQIGEMAELFQMIAGQDCPKEFRTALLLPELLKTRWRRGDVAGEIAISSPIKSLERRLDESLLERKVEGVALADLRIIDAVTDFAGPYFTVFQKTDTSISSTLYLFDNRDLRKMDVNLETYIDLATASLGVVFWQFLLCEGKLTPDKSKALIDGLSELRASTDEPMLDELDRRLAERT
jgi:hypothetical protein